MLGGMIIGFVQGKATDMGSSLAATSSASGPTGTGPSEGPAQTPESAAAATAKRLEDLRKRRIEIIKEHVAAEKGGVDLTRVNESGCVFRPKHEKVQVVGPADTRH